VSTGVVKYFNSERGFGFIQVELPDGNVGAEIFVHNSDLAKGLFELKQRQRVSFEEVASNKGNGKKAVNVRVIA
jgi:CspA family cold shock protein